MTLLEPWVMIRLIAGAVATLLFAYGALIGEDPPLRTPRGGDRRPARARTSSRAGSDAGQVGRHRADLRVFAFGGGGRPPFRRDSRGDVRVRCGRSKPLGLGLHRHHARGQRARRCAVAAVRARPAGSRARFDATSCCILHCACADHRARSGPRRRVADPTRSDRGGLLLLDHAR